MGWEQGSAGMVKELQGDDMSKPHLTCLRRCGTGSTSEKRGSGRGPNTKLGLSISVLLAVSSVLIASVCRAQPPDVGAWRKVFNSGFDRQFHFSMLPGVAPVGSRWVAYDAATGELVCCLTTVSAEASENDLQDRFDIPGPWVTDLTNGWNLDGAPYRPHVQLLEVQDALGTHVFNATGGSSGGLLLPADTRGAGKNALEMAGRRYAVRHSEHALADDDGSIQTYVLVPLDGGTSLRVEVPFGTY